MEVTKEKTEKVLGTKPEKVKQKISVTYTLKTMGTNAAKLKEAGLITLEDLELVLKMQERALKTYIGI